MIELLEVNTSFIEKIHHEFDEEVLKRFPLVKQDFFHKRIVQLHRIEVNHVVTGIAFMTIPIERFKDYGKYDISIIIFKQYRSNGFGKDVIKLLIHKFEDTFFIVERDNDAMLKIIRGSIYTREICIDDKYNIFKSISSNKS